jgi:Ni/Fe-hydrogenase 1 B-type cytochrome subunit
MSRYTTREEHPLPAITLHWVHLVSMFALIFTGFYIHYPFFAGAMSIMRNTHFVAMFVLITTTVLRVYWAFAGRGSASTGSRRLVPDWKHFAPESENKGQLLETLKYYLFLRRSHPRSAKFNTLQKATYISWLVLIVAQAITGFAMWSQTAAAFQPMTYLFGGVTQVRVDHYLIMWLFIATMMIHIYLSMAEAWVEVSIMFVWKETRPRDGASV